jgi:putative ABC transport system permease protein
MDAALLGVQVGQPSTPVLVTGRLPLDGEAVVDVSLRSAAVRLGSRIRVLAGGPPLLVVGYTDAGQFELLPTVWTTLGSWQRLSAAAEPETRGGPPWAQVLTVRLAPGADPARVTVAVRKGLGEDAVTRGQAILAIPGAIAMRSTIEQLIASVLLVSMLVAALFAALYTTERQPELARLRALGASARQLATAVLIQVELPVIVAVLAGYLITSGLLAAAPRGFPATLPFARALGLGALLAAAGALGTIGAVIRVVRIDPATAMEAS